MTDTFKNCGHPNTLENSVLYRGDTTPKCKRCKNAKDRARYAAQGDPRRPASTRWAKPLLEQAWKGAA